MLTQPAPQPSTRLQKLLRFTWLGPAIAALVVGWIFFSRWSDAQRLRARQAQEKQLRESRENRTAFENLGGNRFEILHFYAQPLLIARGESATLCYGASNAAKVKLDPPVEAVWPSANRCFSISPRRDTAYTLTIENSAGETRTATFTLQVR